MVPGWVEILILLIAITLIYFIVKLIRRASKPKQETKASPAYLPVKQNIKETIFINYRKEDSSGYSLALYNELTKWYPKKAVFKDFVTIEPGEDFRNAITDGLSSCNILLVVISNRWHDIMQRRKHG